MQLPYILSSLFIAACIPALANVNACDVSGPAVGASWSENYHAAMDTAKEAGKFTLIWFYEARAASATEQFERQVWSQPEIVRALTERYVPLRLPTDSKVTSGEKHVALLDHPAFAEMQHSPGIAVLDMTDESSPLFRQVVSVYPFRRREIARNELLVMLGLPKGTLTQRTLIFAVRTHPEQPASSASDLSELLARETESHAAHQARIALQGHHQWANRFQAINAQLPRGLVAQEVCAESWPGQTLLEAAEECVDSWRQSSGHWEAVSRRHVLFGYDMKRGANGVWYAAGIFARKM